MELIMTSYHTPVLLEKCLEGLNISPSGTYIDLTFGGGGHSKAILELLDEGRLIAFDQDPDALEEAQTIHEDSFYFVDSNFRYFKKHLKLYGITEVDGILADLGISSHQIDTPQRGFSTRYEGNLDMRMDQQSEITAKDIINDYSEDDLKAIFSKYGEIRNSGTLARAIVSSRIKGNIDTTKDLKEVLSHLVPKGRANKYFAKVFQALRISVNDELRSLEEMLLNSVDVLKQGGRVAIISYHSLEDRIVKNFFNSGNFSGELKKDIYGNIERPLEPVIRKPIMAAEEEVSENKRARSARLRIAQKN